MGDDIKSDEIKADEDEALQFEDAEVESSGPATCGMCQQPITSAYFELNGHTVCESCRHTLEREMKTRIGDGRFLGALVPGARHTLRDREPWRHSTDDDPLHRLLGSGGAQSHRSTQAAESHGEREEGPSRRSAGRRPGCSCGRFHSPRFRRPAKCGSRRFGRPLRR